MPSKRQLTSRNDLQLTAAHLDSVDQRLLAHLADEPRIAMSELARRVGMSAPSVRDRVTRLEESGVIAGYRLVIDPTKVGLPVSAWVRIRPFAGQLPKIADLAQQTPEISECHRVSGEDCFLLRVHIPRIEDLEPILDRFLVYGQTTSSFVGSSPVPPRTPRRST